MAQVLVRQMPRRVNCIACPLVILVLIVPGEPLGATAVMEKQGQKLMRSWSPHQAKVGSASSFEDRVVETSLSLESFSPRPRMVQIYYESLSPAAGRLISNESTGVWAAYNARKGNWSFVLYPWGRAEHTSSGLQCTHGPAECVGNLIHMCALRTLPVDAALAVISCLMREPSSSLLQVGESSKGSWVYDDWTHSGGIHDYISQVADTCWSKLSEPTWKATVEGCINNRTLAIELEDFYREQTLAMNLTRLPSVFVNGSFHAQASSNADLLSYLDD